MKKNNILKSGSTTVSPANERPGGAIFRTAKPAEHRHERRKIREQLRRPDLFSEDPDAEFA